MNCTIIDWNLFFDALQSISVIVASVVAIYSINSWRREAKWKRKYELAEEVLANLYESQQAIRYIRSPIGFQDEGSSRKIDKNETPEQTRVYNQAYVVRERFKNNSDALQKLRSLKYRFIALFGKENEEHFNKFSQTINQIFFAADEIARTKLGEYGNEKEFNLKILRDNSKIIYAKITDKDNDLIEKEIQNAVDKIETECSKVIGKIRN